MMVRLAKSVTDVGSVLPLHLYRIATNTGE